MKQLLLLCSLLFLSMQCSPDEEPQQDNLCDCIQIVEVYDTTQNYLLVSEEANQLQDDCSKDGYFDDYPHPTNSDYVIEESWTCQ